MTRILIVGGGCRGRRLAGALAREGHTLRISTRTEAGRAAIETSGAECWIGDPDRLASMRGALDGVTVACWMLAGAAGGRQAVHALHSGRLEFFLGQMIDTTVRGFLYDASPGALDVEVLAGGSRIARSLAARNAIPLEVLVADPADPADRGGERWIAAASAAIARLIGGPN